MAEPPATLNPAQLAAVHHLAGPCLVLAGAGSGKTRVVTHKIARLLQAGLEPKQIAAITFTNKAAAEMRERAKALVGPRAAKDLVVSTFHSLGVRLLREDGERVGLKPNFSILDSDDVLGVLRDAGGTTDAKTARHWQWAISLWKNQGLNAAQAMAAAGSDDEAVAAKVMQRYEERLSAYQAVDFDDLIGLPLKLLAADAEARAKWQERFRHVLVDEVQDTNAVQYALLKAIVDHPDDRRRGHFTAVGDDDQSIYGWRGATLDNLKRLPQDFPALKVIPLEQNYRSTGHILRAANAVIAGNPKLFDKKLWSELGDGEPVRVIECDGEEHEAERAVAFIQSIRGQGGASKLADFAVLYRANHQARVFEPRAGRASSTAPRSRTCARGCACSSTATTTRPSCVRSAPRNAASATRRWASSASSPAGGRRACSSRCSRPASRPRSGRRRSRRCTSSAATSTTSSTAPATPRARRTRARCCSAGCRTSATSSTCTTARTTPSLPPRRLDRAALRR